MRLLRNRSLAAVLTAELVSLTGSSMTFVALPWFVLATTGSTARMGWVLAAELVPVGLLGIPSGSVIARLGAKRTMNIADAARAPIFALIPILHWTGHLTFPVLLALAFAAGCFLAPYYASSRLIMPEVVGEDERLVAEGTAISQGVQQLTTLAGPILGGLLIAWVSAPSVLLVDAATYVFSFAVIALFVRVGARARPEETARGLFAGVKFLAHDRLLASLFSITPIVTFLAQILVATLPVLVYRRYNADAKIVGFLFAAFGAGALIGSLLAARLVRRVPLLRLCAAALLGMSLPLWLLLIQMPWSAAVVVLVAFGICAPMVNAPLIATITMRSPVSVRPKVVTALMTISGIVGPLGFLAAGEGLQYISLTNMFLIVAGGFTLGALLFAIVVRRETATAVTAVPEPV